MTGRILFVVSWLTYGATISFVLLRFLPTYFGVRDAPPINSALLSASLAGLWVVLLVFGGPKLASYISESDRWKHFLKKGE